ncbi:nicotinamidase-related amidase [Peribacillus deserti]|uniref:Nicotinamidase-related amidase n=1 Tax=Peribacillus deserti TaxID=673318 RepID=A0ABS2QHU0_9BACI|nr:cysteine hydrolase family protein [Peribacillus deserti]MBM7692707.1 nicotinamidase-related amidase [Peribacillus deserti]
MAAFGKNSALLIIDVQKGFDSEKWGARNNPDAEENIFKLLTQWRKRELPVIHTQHLSRNPNSPLFPGQDGCEIKELVLPLEGEAVIQKNVNSAFIGTELEEYLRKNEIDTLVITGLITPHCVSTTARMSANLGFTTYVVSDAAAAFDIIGHNGILYQAEEVHNLSLATLHKEFAAIVTTEDILAGK